MEPTTHQQPHPISVHLRLPTPRLEGRDLAAILMWARKLVEGAVAVTDLEIEPARVELRGSSEVVARLREAVEQGAVGLPDTLRPTLEREPWQRSCDARPTRVLLVDGRPERARQHAEILSSAEIEAVVVSEVRQALALLRSSALTIDALVLRHRLFDGTALQILESLPPAQRRCSVLVIDDAPERGRAQDYRALGAFRYVEEPQGRLELIGAVNSTIVDTLTWRNAGRRRRDRIAGAPPVVYLDPSHAADRLAHLYDFTPTQREVAYMVLMGRRDVDIAQRLKRSERTAKRIVSHILSAAGIHNRTSLWAALYHEGRGETPEPAREESIATASGVNAPHSPAAEPAPSRPGFTHS